MTTFPATQHSLVAALRSSDATVRERGVALAVQVYRAPVVAVAILRWGLQSADAEDLAHDFLLHALEKDWFLRYDPVRGRFRTFVRACLMAFAQTRSESANRLKRGGQVIHVELDQIDVATPHTEMDSLFDREWVRSVFALSLQGFRDDCARANHAQRCAVFEAHDIDGAELLTPPSYHDTAKQFGIPVSQVTNFLNWSRRQFRQHVLNTLRALTTSDAEFRDEARALLGVVIP